MRTATGAFVSTDDESECSGEFLNRIADHTAHRRTAIRDSCRKGVSDLVRRIGKGGLQGRGENLHVETAPLPEKEAGSGPIAAPPPIDGRGLPIQFDGIDPEGA